MSVHIADTALSQPQKSTNDRAIVRIPAPLRLFFQAGARISPRLGAGIARQLFFRPPSVPYRPEQKKMLALAQAVSLEARGKRVRAYSWGEGPTVLLLHGWGGHAGQMTEFVAPLVKAGYRVLAIDAPAHGRSAGKLSSIVHFTAAIEAAVSALGPLHAVVAHSMGATATAHALARGLEVERAVFIAPQASLTGYWQIFRSALGMPEEIWHIMRRSTERWLKVRYDELHPEGIAPRMTTPLLVLHGTTDRMTPMTEGASLAAAWPGALFRPLDCGHLAILRDWRALLASVDFIQGREIG